LSPDSNRKESEGGDHVTKFRRKKGKKPKAPLKWRSTNSDMSNYNGGKAEGSDGDRGDDDMVLSSLTAADSSFSNLISNRRILGKVTPCFAFSELHHSIIYVQTT
jgi:hypothetical protein